MKKNFLKLICLIATPIIMFSCSNKGADISNIHFDNEEHYIYDEDKDEIIKEKHTYNSEHKCSVCGYEDPILIIDQDGILKGLTEHGKTLEKITLTNKVYFIDDNAFEGSNVKNIHLTKNIFGMGAKAHDFISNIEYDTEGEVPELVKKDQSYFVPDLFSEDYECFTVKKKYKELSKAISEVDEDNRTIFLLKDEINMNYLIEPVLNFRIVNTPILVRESHLKGGIINVLPSCNIEFGKNVNYTGEINLILRNMKPNYTSGSVAFQDKTEAPNGLSVYYTGEHLGRNKRDVHGSCQTVNKVLVIPVDYYSYGTLEFNQGFNVVTGLSPYGKTCSRITITSPTLGISAEIEKEAFTQKYNKTIKIISKLVDFTVWVVEGVFNHVTIGDGITKVGEYAFCSLVETKLTETLTEFIATIFCHVTSLTIGNSCEYLEANSFHHEYKLTTINGGCNSLKEIKAGSFHSCKNLKLVDLSTAFNLTRIDLSFNNCKILSRFLLPYSNGWRFGENTFLFEDLNPENVAKYVISNRYILNKDSSVDNKFFAVINPNQVDEYKVPNYVRYYSTFEEALNNTKDGEILFLLSATNDLSKNTYEIKRKITIDASKSLDEQASLKCNFKVNKDCYLKILSKVNFIGNITLCNENSTNISKTGGVTFEYSGVSRNDSNAKVLFENYNKEINVIRTMINDKYYSSYGLFNFNLNDKTETITSMSELGKIMTGMVIDNTFDEDDNITINDNVFSNNKIIEELEIYRKVTSISEGCFKNSNFSKMSFAPNANLKVIPKYAFQNCPNFKTLELSTLNNLSEIKEYAFDGCKFSIAMVLYHTGWKYDGKDIPETEMKDSSLFATRLTTTHTKSVWSHTF